MLTLEPHKQLGKKKYGKLSHELIIKARTSNSAFKKITKETDRISIRFARTSSIKKMDIDDLIQEGRIIAWDCLYKWDPERGASFTSFFTDCLLHKFDKHRKKERAEKRTIDRTSESLFKTLEENTSLIDTIVDEAQDQRLENINNKIYLRQISKFLSPDGQMLISFMLRDFTIDEIAKNFKVNQSTIRNMFKKHVIRQVEEAKKLGLIEQ